MRITLHVGVPSGVTVKVIDTLPNQFTYIPGTFEVNGVSAIPTVTDQQVAYTITDPCYHKIEFEAKVTEAKWEDWMVYDTAKVEWYKCGEIYHEKEITVPFVIEAFEELQKSVIGYFTLTQGENTWIIDPIEYAETATGFYDYYSVSAHTGLEEPYHSFIYLYRDTTTPSDQVSLFIVHDIDGNVYYPGKGYNSGSPNAQCWMNLSGIPSGAYLAQSDDPGEFYFSTASTAKGRWHWWYNTDGGAISGLPTTSSWCITIDPRYWVDVDVWEYYREGDVNINLDMTQPITICHTPVKSVAVMVETKVQFAVEIEITNPFSYPMTDTVISDRFGAELMIDYIIAGGFTYEFEYSDYGTKNAEVEIFKDGLPMDTSDLDKTGVTFGNEPCKFNIFWTGKSHKVHFEWTIGNLGSGDSTSIIIGVSTDTNPAGHQEYTTSGVYELNSGATLKFIDPEQDMQLSAVTDSIYVEVYDVIIF
ncbi:MAG: hypothetical protein ACFE94_05845 [Candidatus Hodarchaeota archaeon]